MGIESPSSAPEHVASLDETALKERALRAALNAMSLASALSPHKKTIELMLNDPFKKSLVLGLIHVDAAGNLQFLHEKELQIRAAQTANSNPKFAETLRREITKVIDAVGAFFNTLHAHEKNINDAMTSYTNAGGPTTLKEPDKINKFVENHDDVNKFMGAIATLIDEAIKLGGEKKPNREVKHLLLVTMEKHTLKDEHKKALSKILDDIKNDDTVFTDADTVKSLKEASKIPLTAGQKSEIDGALTAADIALAKNQESLKIVRFTQFADSTRFFEKIGGSDASAIVEGSFLKSGAFSFDVLKAHLTALGKTVTDVQMNAIKAASGLDIDNISLASHNFNFTEYNGVISLGNPLGPLSDLFTQEDYVSFLTATLLLSGKQALKSNAIFQECFNSSDYDKAIEALSKVWNTQPLIDHITKIFNLTNPPGVDLYQHYLSIALPDEVMKGLKDSKLENDIEPRTIGAMANIAGLVLGPQTPTDNLFNAITFQEGSPPVKKVNKKIFTQMRILLQCVGTPAAANALKIETDNAWQTLTTTPSVLKKDATATDVFEIMDETKFKAELGTWSVSAKAIEYYNTLNASTGIKSFTKVDWARRTASKTLALAGVATQSWWDYFSNLPRVFHDTAHDSQIEELRKQGQALKDYQTGWKSLQSAINDYSTAMDAVETSSRSSEAERQKVREGFATTSNPKEKYNQSRILLEHAALTLDMLTKNPVWVAESSEEKKIIAFYIAVHRSLDDAIAYLRTPDPYKDDIAKDGAIMLKRGAAYIRAIDEHTELSGIDILSRMRKKYKVDVHGDALRRMEMNGKDDAPLAIGPARIDEWFTNRGAAREALDAILFDTETDPSKRNKSNLIEAFCKKTDHGGVTAIEAEQAVRNVQAHLKNQVLIQRDSPRILSKNERFSDPIQLLESSVETVTDMIKNGSNVEKVLGITFLAGALWGIYKMATKGGWLGKGVAIGIPMALALNKMVQNRTGESIMDRLNINLMSPEDAAAPVEQFVRIAAKRPGYEALGTRAGWAAVRAIMNPKGTPPTLAQLVEWKRLAGGEDPARGAPENLNISDIMYEMGTDIDSDAAKKKAYGLVLLAFDALCVDVAESHAVTDDKPGKGLKILSEKYIGFVDPKEVGDDDAFDKRYRELMKGYEHVTGRGLTALDVLIFEHRTPAINDYFTNPTIAEAAAKALGMTATVFMRKILSGIPLAQIFIEAKADSLSRGLVSAVDALSHYSGSAANYLSLVWSKAAPEALATYDATRNALLGLLNTAGLTIKTVGTGAIEWGIIEGTGAAAFTAAQAQNIYSYLRTAAGDPSTLLGSFVDFVNSRFSGNILVYNAATDDPEITRLCGILTPKDADLLALHVMLGKSGLPAAKTTEIHNKFLTLAYAAAAAGSMPVDTPDKRNISFLTLAGLNVTDRKTHENQLLGNTQFAYAKLTSLATSDLNELVTLRDSLPPTGKENLQHFMNRLVLQLMKKHVNVLAAKVAANSLANVFGKTGRATIAESTTLNTLYKATNTNGEGVAADLVSQTLEFILYIGKRSEDVGGKKNYEKFEEYMTTNRLTPTPSSRTRMDDRDVSGITIDILTNFILNGINAEIANLAI